MKFSDVVPDRFKGPHHQEFSTWLRKVELAFRVTKTDDVHKTDHLLAYMDPPAQDIAMQFVEAYGKEHDDSGMTAAQLKLYHRTLYDELVKHMKTKSASWVLGPSCGCSNNGRICGKKMQKQWGNIIIA